MADRFSQDTTPEAVFYSSKAGAISYTCLFL